MKAMVLAAGRGTRLAEWTRTTPKPMIPVAGDSVVGHTLRRLGWYGFQEVVINVHHLADKLMAHVGDGSAWGVRVVWSEENVLLETGGGVRQALPLLGEHPFLAVNGDILWNLDLHPMLAAFDPERMDALLGLVDNPPGFQGDFVLRSDDRLHRGTGMAGSLTYCGIQILHPRAVMPYPLAPFSLNRVYDQAMTAGRVFGIRLQGQWLDMGTPERLAQAERLFGP